MYADTELVAAVRREYPNYEICEWFLLSLLKRGLIGMDGFRYCFKEEAEKAHELARQDRCA